MIGRATWSHLTAMMALVLSGAIFGFFYAWVCSTMWGLDRAEPRVAIAAMQAMNASVRNAVFFPAFFLTPVVLMLAACCAWWASARLAAAWFLGAAAVYFLGTFLPTALVNVPMNDALAQVAGLDDPHHAADIWKAYSPRWQWWNTARTIASLVALMAAGLGLLSLPRMGIASRRGGADHPAGMSRG